MLRLQGQQELLPPEGQIKWSQAVVTRAHQKDLGAAYYSAISDMHTDSLVLFKKCV